MLGISKRYQAGIWTFFGLTTSLTKSVESVSSAVLIVTEQNASLQIIFEHFCLLNGRYIRICLVGYKSTLVFT